MVKTSSATQKIDLAKVFQKYDELISLRDKLSPFEFSRKRENILVDFLNGLAQKFGKNILHTMIDSGGDLRFCLTGGGKSEFGDELAAVLSKVNRRYGVFHISTPANPVNNHCYINHFNVENLLRIVQKEFYLEKRMNNMQTEMKRSDDHTVEQPKV
jgi:hypothetical protein